MAQTVLYRLVAYQRTSSSWRHRRAAVPDCVAADGLEAPGNAGGLWTERFLRSVHNVGILFDPAHNERRAAQVAATLNSAGYAPVLVPMTGPTALPSALIQLTKNVDVLPAIPDTIVFARKHSPDAMRVNDR
jgi:hypothetical protein